MADITDEEFDMVQEMMSLLENEYYKSNAKGAFSVVAKRVVNMELRLRALELRDKNNG